ncbi:TPA: DUF6338 family protein [Aeromonas veronii]|uniref:DUF6338 family protein n=1 Tax=Aeromonas hydrophila TaxID=644 RepID=UPI0009B91FC1|nr:DUF6338 family protein [Aeromonas hydrophila]HDO1383462.1 hypothetical protein [Aeromonas veronii]
MSLELLELNKLLLFVAFVMPGFIAIKAYELFAVASERKSTSEQLIDAVSYSCINYVIWLPVVYAIESGELRNVHFWLYVLFYFTVLFVSPVAISYLWVKVRIGRFKQHPIQRPWDYVFSSLEPHWVLVTLKSGEKIGGYYGPNSFASSSPAPEQIFLQSSWVINEDEGFERVKETTAGILILSSEILYLEFYKAD